MTTNPDARSLDDIPYIEWTIGASVQRIYADAWTSEQVSATATITVHAVETGSKVADHYLPDQLTAKASLFISGSPIRGDLDPDFVGQNTTVPFIRPQYPNNTPLLSPGGLLNAAGSVVSSAASALGLGSKDPLPDHLTVFAFNQDPRGRLKKVLEQLLDLRQSATLVTVNFSKAGRVENLGISSISLQRTADDGDSGTIELEFQQMNFVSTQSAAAIPVPKEPRAKPKMDSVTFSATDANDADKSFAEAVKQKAAQAFGVHP